MTVRSLAVIFAAVVSAFSLMAVLDDATAQKANSCSRMCDCDFECVDFCGSGRCPCPKLTKMKTACQKACKTCKQLKLSPKKAASIAVGGRA